MHVFVTGASGDIASCLIPELVSAGHTVTGLARSEQSAERVRALGADVRMGDLSDLDALREGAASADGVVHLAFDHQQQGSGNLAGAVDADVRAVEAIGEALTGTGKPFVGTNATGGIALAGFRGVLTEDDTLPGGPRIDTENRIIALAQAGVRSSVVRLPPAVHSERKYGFASRLVDIARGTGVSGWIGDGANRWPSADARDVAHLYRLALEQAPAGSRWQAIAEEGIALRDIATTIGERLGLPAEPVDADRAPQHFGFLAAFVALDNPATSTLTRERLGWTPTRPGLLEALRTDPRLTAH